MKYKRRLAAVGDIYQITMVRFDEYKNFEGLLLIATKIEPWGIVGMVPKLGDGVEMCLSWTEISLVGRAVLIPDMADKSKEEE